MKSTPYLICISFGTHDCLAIKVILSLIIEDTKSSYSISSTCVGTILPIFISPILRNNDLVNGPYHIHLQLLILFSGGAQTRRSIDLDEPRLAIIIN